MSYELRLQPLRTRLQLFRWLFLCTQLAILMKPVRRLLHTVRQVILKAYLEPSLSLLPITPSSP